MATRRSSTRGALRRRKTTRGRPRVRAAPGTAGLEFNHAMIYTTRLPHALEFYRDALGFQVVDEYPGAYARMKSPGGGTTIALHVMEEGKELDTKKEGLRLMPWGWKHAYLRDPDGHEISLYWAGRARLHRTVMRDEDH